MARVWCSRPVRQFEAVRRASGVYVRELAGGEWVALDQPPPGFCPFCWHEHKPGAAHAVAAPIYAARFYAAHGRAPTVADSLAHCRQSVRSQARARLIKSGLWHLPPPGVAIIAEALTAPGAVGVRL